MSTKVNFVLEQSTTFSKTFDLLNADDTDLVVTGYTANAAMKKHYDSLDSVAKVFTCALVNGSITISMTAAQTANIEGGRYVYDIRLTDDSNNVTRPYEGLVSVMPNVAD